MQKSTKRLLSMLAVLALVLTMAPAGILAVETKAASAVPADVAATMATEQAKQATAVAALKALTETDATARLAELNAALPTCPFCGRTDDWELVASNSSSIYSSTDLTKGRHYYIYGTVTKTVANAIHMSADNGVACILLDGNIETTGRVLMNKTGATLNIGGKGSIISDMSAAGAILASGQGGMLQIMGGSTLNLYGGTFVNNGSKALDTNYTGFNRALVHLSTAAATLNIWTDDVVLGPEAPATSAKMNVRLQAGTVNMYGGTIQNAYTATGWEQGWNMFIQGTSTFNMYGGTIKDGNGSTKGVGANVHVQTATANFNMYGGTISGGKATNGGNVYVVKNGSANLYGGVIEKGHATVQGGNVSVSEGATLNVGSVEIKGGVSDSAALSSNVRIWDGATLKLTGNAKCGGQILMTNTGYITVEPTFTGDVYVWHTGGVTLGGAVANSSATAAAPGHVYNGAYQPATGVYMPVEMTWDGATGLKYAANGVVYNGSLRAAASAQAAVDTYVADMANEEVTAKPQYVMIDGNVNIGAADVNIGALADITVSGTGTVYGVDRANDAYAATSGSITADGVTVAAEVTAGGRHYIALSNTAAPSKYTFHRVESDLTNITINKENAGMYYKAQYQFDAEVAERVVSYGVLVKLNEAVNVDNATKFTSSNDMTKYDAETHTLTASSHGVYGVFKDANAPATNAENGAMKLYGNPYLAINTTGENKEASEYAKFDATSVGMSMYDAMELANEKWEDLSEEDRGHLNEFVSYWNAKGAWTAELLEALTNFTIA